MKSNRYYLYVMVYVILLPIIFGCSNTKGSNAVGHLPGPQFTLSVSKTTLVQTLVPVEPAVNPIDPNDIPQSMSQNFGKFTIGPGEDFTFRNDLNIAGAVPTLSASARSVVYFPVITDIHIMDTKTPLRFFYTYDDNGVTKSVLPQAQYSPQVLDAMIRTLNDFSKTRHYDLFINTGDTVNDTALNETRWFIDILDGNIVVPDSGTHRDIVPGPLNDAHDPFLAWGLDKHVPWYTTMGNHDALIAGHFAVTPVYNAIAIGDTVYIGSEDDYGNVLSAGTKVTPDIKRTLIGPVGYMQEFFTTTTLPVGHGFTAANISSGYGDYAFDVSGSIPLRFIVLDWQCRAGETGGCIRQDEFDNFLVPELDRAAREHKLVIIASHQSPDSLDITTQITGTAFIDLLISHPNVILHLVGHGHYNSIVPRAGVSATQPGYWQIETSSLINYPQQSRIIEVVDNGNGTGIIFTTMVDHNSPDGSMPALSRSLSLNMVQTGNDSEGREGSFSDRNTELAIKIPPDVEAALQSASLPSKIESLTTLRGE